MGNVTVALVGRHSPQCGASFPAVTSRECATSYYHVTASPAFPVVFVVLRLRRPVVIHDDWFFIESESGKHVGQLDPLTYEQTFANTYSHTVYNTSQAACRPFAHEQVKAYTHARSHMDLIRSTEPIEMVQLVKK